MNVTTTPDTETVSLEHLEFTPKCGIRLCLFIFRVKLHRCRRKAVWMAILPCGCGKHTTACNKIATPTTVQHFDAVTANRFGGHRTRSAG